MSVVIVVKVSEGLVLGADSAATIHGAVETPDGQQQGILKTYFNARKLLQIGDFPIGVLTWGQAAIGMRTLESIVREWEFNENWQSKEDYEKARDGDKSFSVKACVQGLKAHLASIYEDNFDGDRPLIGMVVAGYSHRNYFPEIWRFVLPDDIDGEVHNQRPDIDGQPDFGASWFGATDAIVRLHFGRDEGALHKISSEYNIDIGELRDLVEPFQYLIPWPVMPLQDAIEYANYMLNVAVGRYRFVVGPELCGGEIEIAAITQNRFNWIRRKVWSLDGK